MWSLGMILHKMLFFRLPYHHTVDNDEASRPKDGRDYMDRLEAEILEYTGFKSSSILASGFEPRRLPKIYLLLLETLLNVRPSARPSSERVLGVIKEGGVSLYHRFVVCLQSDMKRLAQSGAGRQRGPIHTGSCAFHPCADKL